MTDAIDNFFHSAADFDEELAKASAAYVSTIEDDLKAKGPFDEGMMVFVRHCTREFYGRVVKELGWSEFWKMHKYDVLDFDGSICMGVFACDMERVSFDGSTRAALFRGMNGVR